MAWQDFMDSNRAWLEQRAVLVEAANDIRDRYCAFMAPFAQHFRYPEHLTGRAAHYKFVPEKSSEAKGYFFAVGRYSFRIPADYLRNPQAWEASLFEEIEARYELIRNSASAEFVASIGDVETAEETDAGVDCLVFCTKGYRTTSVPGQRVYSKKYYIDKATGKLYDSPNGTYILFREIASGHAVPLEL